MRFKLYQTAALLTFCAVLLSGCFGNSNADTAGGQSGTKLKIVTSFYPMYEFTRQVAGEYADVVALIPGGVEPHDWEPSAKDMARISDADVFVYNGLVEGWVEQALSSAKNDKRVAVEASAGITLEPGIGEEDDETPGNQGAEQDSLDPHVWLDPVLAQKEVAHIQAALQKADPAHQEQYKANAAAYIAKLQTLDQLFQTGLKELKRRDFVTQHAAFGYLAKQYGLTQVPISGLSPELEPTPAHMAEVVKMVKAKQIKTIFFEELVDPKIAKTIADETGAKTAVLNPIEGLTADDKKNNLDYIGLMKNNLKALQQALNE